MKKVFLGFTMLVCFIAFSNISHAQDSTKVKKAVHKAKSTTAKAKQTATAATTTATTAPAAATTAAKTKVKTAKAKVAATTAAASTTATTAPATVAKTAKTKVAKTVANPVNKSADQAVGTDAKGRTIYQGPKGGKYTLSPSGNKEYIEAKK